MRPAATWRRTSSGTRRVIAEPGGELVDTRFVAMRRDQFQIIDNWDTLGMRGTGSRRVVVEDLFIPEHHTVPSPNPLRPVVEFPGRGLHSEPDRSTGRSGPCSSPSRPRSASASRRRRSTSTSRTSRRSTSGARCRRSAPSCRCSSGCWERRRRTSTPRRRRCTRSRQMWTELARRSMETGEPVSDEDDRRLILIEQQIVQLASKAVETIFRTSGSSACEQGPADRALLPRPQHDPHARHAPVRAHVGERRAHAARPPAGDAALAAGAGRRPVTRPLLP